MLFCYEYELVIYPHFRVLVMTLIFNGFPMVLLITQYVQYIKFLVRIKRNSKIESLIYNNCIHLVDKSGMLNPKLLLNILKR